MPKTFSTAKKQVYINHNGLKVMIKSASPRYGTTIKITDCKHLQKATHKFSIDFIEKSIACLKMTSDVPIIFYFNLRFGRKRIKEQAFFQLLSLINDKSKFEELAIKQLPPFVIPCL